VCAFTCLGGFLFLTTLYLQDVRGFSAWEAGVRLIPLAATTAVAGPIAGRVMGRRGGRGLFIGAGAAFAASCLVLALAPTPPSAAVLFASYAVFGAGYGAVNAVIADAAVAGMPRARAGVAGGMTSAGRQAGQSLGVSVAGAMLAAGLHGPLRSGFGSASQPVWLVLAAAGSVVLLLGIVSTSRRAIRMAGLVGAPATDHAPNAIDRVATGGK
jgi:MFS family permease